MHQLAPIVADQEEDEERLEGERLHREEIGRPDLLSVQLEERCAVPLMDPYAI